MALPLCLPLCLFSLCDCLRNHAFTCIYVGRLAVWLSLQGAEKERMFLHVCFCVPLRLCVAFLGDSERVHLAQP